MAGDEFGPAIAAAYATEGEASGVPRPVVHTKLVAPVSRMRPADDVDAAAKASPLWARVAAPAPPRGVFGLLKKSL